MFDTVQSVFKFPTQFLRRNSRGKLSLHLNYHISWCYSGAGCIKLLITF